MKKEWHQKYYTSERKFFTETTIEKLLGYAEQGQIPWVEVAEHYLDPEHLQDKAFSLQGIFLQWLN